MLKKIIVSAAIILGSIILVIGLIIIIYKPDNEKFKYEYEKINNEEKYQKVEIPLDNHVKYANFNKTINFLKKGTGILYLGYPTCIQCRDAAPLLIKTAISNEVEDIYYLNTKNLKSGQRQQLSKILKTEIKNPTAVFVMGGKIVGIHTGTIGSNALSAKEEKELLKIYNENIEKIYGICDTNKTC